VGVKEEGVSCTTRIMEQVSRELYSACSVIQHSQLFVAFNGVKLPNQRSRYKTQTSFQGLLQMAAL
jgi:hypothetical protein